MKQWVEDEHHLCQLSKRQEEHECKLRKGKLAGELRVVDKKLETEKHYKMTKIEDYTVEI